MRLPNEAHTAHDWCIREIAADFRVEDVWALPAHGTAADFQLLLDKMVAADPANGQSTAARVLWRARDLLGRWFDLGRISAPADGVSRLPIPGTAELSLAGRLPPALRGSAADITFGSLPFVPLYRTDDEFAAEISNQTMHGVMHLAWAPVGAGRYQGQMAVYVKPRGRLGQAYMAFIAPFRHWIVYPGLMRQIEREWSTPTG
jgi:hypothetical protein